MKKIDKSAIVFLVLGLFVIAETRNMTIGSFANPGPGLFPLLLGIILLIFSLISLFKSSVKKVFESSEKTKLRNVFYVLGILLFFRLSLPVLGYSLTTIIMFLFLLRIFGSKKWFLTIAWSIIFTGISYLMFGKWFLVQFPRGIFPF